MSNEAKSEAKKSLRLFSRVNFRITAGALGLIGLISLGPTSRACIWDADTMVQERLRSSDMASVILKDPPAPPDPIPLRKRIATLTAAPRTNDPAWWNDLAGAHLRLGEPKEAVALLEGVTNRFPDDYGVHANLGTAYHLLGRYVDAEREIARDLEINPDAHFGLERYHLALLQYLMRDADYQSNHVYVDEWSYSFFTTRGYRVYKADGKLNSTNAYDLKDISSDEFQKYSHGETNDWPAEEIEMMKAMQALATQPAPAYRFKWDLAADPKFREGIMYMATMNPKEPACFVMLGIACIRSGDYNLAAAAYERAIKLGALPSWQLQMRIDSLRKYIRGSLEEKIPMYLLASAFLFVIGLYVFLKIKERRRKAG